MGAARVFVDEGEIAAMDEVISNCCPGCKRAREESEFNRSNAAVVVWYFLAILSKESPAFTVYIVPSSGVASRCFFPLALLYNVFDCSFNFSLKVAAEVIGSSNVDVLRGSVTPCRNPGFSCLNFVT